MGQTVRSLWHQLSGLEVADDLVEWPPDVFALTDVLLEHSEAYRFAVSPPVGCRWPPRPNPQWSDDIRVSARQWRAWAENPVWPPPELVARGWQTLADGATTPLDDLATGRTWGLCEAILTLHAVADEACVAMGVSVHHPTPVGWITRARAGELLARSGTLARIPRDRLRVLPKVRTPDGGISFRSVSRYVCVRNAKVDAVWHKAPARRLGTAQQRANILLLPWPLRVRERDFRPVAGSVQRTENEPFGFFEFAPPEGLDLDLLERVIVAAHEEVETVDVVILPEGAVPTGQLDELEEILARHRVTIVIAGMREPPAALDAPMPVNWVHLGVHLGGRWWRYHQNKHHRWFLDENQIDQYNLGGALHPGVRWWEASQLPQRAVQFIELAEGITLVAVVCEDLARLDEVADLLRAVGPTLVVTVLLDGPQLTNRWTARYASVLADDPGSAVLTLTAFGFVQRSRPPGFPPSAVVALWKDSVHGFRELALENAAQGILLSTTVGHARRRSADGRLPADNAVELLVSGVIEVHATDSPDGPRPARGDASAVASELGPLDLTILTVWSEAVGDSMMIAPEFVELVLSDAGPNAPWRKAFGLEEPSPQLAGALESMATLLRDPSLPHSDPLARLAHSVLTSVRDARRPS